MLDGAPDLQWKVFCLLVNVVREWMGHPRMPTTQQFYTQVDSDHKARGARIVQQLIDGPDTKKTTKKTDARPAPEADSDQIGDDQ